MRVLYVEDNLVNALLLEEALRLEGGFELRVAEDAQEALELAREWQPDVLVLDAHLPGVSGYDLLQQLRVQPGCADLPAFMCSGDSEARDLERAAAAGFRGYWPKPVDIDLMLADLQQLRSGE
ncbi:MAG TPA: response regulator [Burkholderiaceae bacterium]|nr:response regulator [Burkholderiaceae bacterium]